MRKRLLASRLILGVAWWLSVCGAVCGADAGPAGVVLRARDFGVVGDGVADDGPAIQHAVAALCGQDEPAVLQFEAGKTYRVSEVDAIRLFRLEECRDVTIDGGRSTFLLAGDVRFALLRGAQNVRLRNLSLDYDPLPFVDGLIVTKNAADRYVDVRVFDEFAMPPLGGPTREGGEQAYFGMLWTQGHHGLIGHHFYVLDMQMPDADSAAGRVVRVFTDFERFELIEEGVHAISLPVRGIAHRCMDGATVRIADCENVEVAAVNVWSAPWFAFQLFRNRGQVTFRDVDIRPRPDGNRRTSSWRDGIHAKSNRADLLFAGCHLEGMNDDSMNIATHMSRVMKVVSPTEIQVRQVYPLEIAPFAPGDRIAFYGVRQGAPAGDARLARCEGVQATEYSSDGRPRGPLLTLHLETPVAGLEPGDRLWNETSANPITVIRDCVIHNSCRFQSPVTIEGCRLNAFCWFHSEDIEGPIPSRVVIRDSALRLGRGNHALAASFDGILRIGNASPPPAPQAAIAKVLLERNTVDGLVRLAGIKQLELHENRFHGPRSKLLLTRCDNVLLADNELGGERIERVSQLNVADEPTRSAIEIRNRR